MKRKLPRILFGLFALGACLALFLIFKDSHGFYSSPDKVRTGTGVYAWNDIFDGVPPSKPANHLGRRISMKRSGNGDKLVFELGPSPAPFPVGEPEGAKIVRAEGVLAVLPNGARIRLAGVRRKFATAARSTGGFQTRRLWLDPSSQQLLDTSDDRLEKLARECGGNPEVTGFSVNHAWFGVLVETEGDPDLRWVDLTILDPDTHFENGHLSRDASFPPNAFLEAEFRRYHGGKLLVALTCATGPTTTFRVPLEPGTVEWIGAGSVKIHRVVRERWEGRNPEKRGYEIELIGPNPDEAGTVACLSFDPGLVGTQLRLTGGGEPIEFDDPGRGFAVVSIPGEPAELAFDFRPNFYHVIFEIDAAPLFPGNENPENLFDVRVPYLVPENDFYLRWAIGHGVQMELDTGSFDFDHEKQVEHRNLTFAEMLQDHAGEKVIRVDADAGRIEIGGVETRWEQIKSWFRRQRDRWF